MPSRVLPPARFISKDFLTLTLGWAVLGFNFAVLSMSMIAGLQVIYASFRTPMMGYAFVVYVTVVAPVLLAMTAIRFFRSRLDRGGAAAGLGLVVTAAMLATWTWMVASA